MAFLRSRRFVLALLVALAVASPWHGGRAQGDQHEYALKAVFLYNFCRFIEWPDRAFSSPDEPIVIGVIGSDPFGGLLEQTVSGEMLRGRRIEIQRYRRPGEIGRCHVLFVSAAEQGRVDEILKAVAGRSIVTVGETDWFLERGGMIALTAERGRVRLRISPTRMRAVNLVASSKLLRVAEIQL